LAITLVIGAFVHNLSEVFSKALPLTSKAEIASVKLQFGWKQGTLLALNANAKSALLSKYAFHAPNLNTHCTRELYVFGPASLK